MPLLLLLATLSPADATTASLDALRSDDGWSAVHTRKRDAGDVEIWVKYLDGLPCLRGETTAEVDSAQMMAAVSDVPSALRWSSAGLTESRVVGRGDGWVEFHQYLDVPNWTLAADRYWILRGQWIPAPSGGGTYQWNKVPDTVHADVRASVLKSNPKAIEPPVNFGAWSFTPENGKTRVRYEICTDTGGSLPTSLQRFIATRTLPDTLDDLLKEAQLR